MRIPIPEDIAAQVMVQHNRTCCVCTIPGKNVQIHHVDENPANNDPTNLAVLCLECHNDTQVTGGFGRKLRAPELIKHRDEWIQRIKAQKEEVDRILIARMSSIDPATPASDKAWYPPSDKALLAFINSLPDTLRYIYEQAQPEWDSGVRMRMLSGTRLVIDVLEQTWVRLAAWYPPNHFEGMPPDQYIGEFVMRRHIWNAALGEPDGHGTGGRDAGLISAGETLIDLENAIVETARWLSTCRLDGFDFETWLSRWETAKKHKEERCAPS